jgi:hypothetical protein
LVAGVVVLVDEAEFGLLQADEIRTGGDGRVAVAGQDRGDIDGQAEAPRRDPHPCHDHRSRAAMDHRDDNKTGKDQLGLDAYQVRNWTPWHRHVTICMLAHAFLAVTRARLGKDHQPRPPGRSVDPESPHPLQPRRDPRSAIRDPLAATVLARDALDHAAAITRDLWRRTHQTRALISHDRDAETRYPKISECSTGVPS